MTWQTTIITLMPEMYPGPLGCSLIGDALARGLWQLNVINLRDFGIGKHQVVDDSPYGGGAGMVLKPDVADAAIMAAKARCNSLPLAGRVREGGEHTNPPPHPPHPQEGGAPPSPARGEGKKAQLIHFSPRGERITQATFRELSQTPLILFCGRYEALDERVLDKHQPRELSLGDFVLTGGDIPAMALIEGCVRLLPGVVGSHDSLGEESFGDGDYANLLEYPHYTKPAVWEGREVPPVLVSGHHANVAKWRREQAEAVTRARRPDLLR